VKELTAFELDVWDNKTEQFLVHNPDSVAKPFCVALLDAIFTIRMRDEEIESLKNK
jgi:hypothetical protein